MPVHYLENCGFQSSPCCKDFLKCVFSKSYWKYSKFHETLSKAQNECNNRLSEPFAASSYGFLLTNSTSATRFLKNHLALDLANFEANQKTKYLPKMAVQINLEDV